MMEVPGRSTPTGTGKDACVFSWHHLYLFNPIGNSQLAQAMYTYTRLSLEGRTRAYFLVSIPLGSLQYQYLFNPQLAQDIAQIKYLVQVEVLPSQSLVDFAIYTNLRIRL
jgi:hypothetical protein